MKTTPTDRPRLLQALEEQGADLCSLLGVGLWHWNLECSKDEGPVFWQRPDPVDDRVLAIIREDVCKKVLGHFSGDCAAPPYDRVWQYRHADGSRRWIRNQAVALRDTQGAVVRLTGAHSDVTAIQQTQIDALEQAEQAQQLNARLKASNDQLELFAQSIGAGQWSRTDSQAITWSKEVWELLGYDQPGDVVENGMFRRHLDDDDLQRYAEALSRMHEKNEPLDIEVNARLKNGQRRWLRVTARIVNDAKGSRVAGAVQDLDKLYRLQALDSKLSTTMAELKHQSEQTRFSNNELRALAYASSHDLQSPINSLRLVLQAIDGDIEEGDLEGARQWVSKGAGIIEQGAELVDNILGYMQTVGIEQNNGLVDLSDVVAEVVANFEEHTGVLHINPVLPLITGDLQQLKILMQNLISNALKFRKAEGQHRVSIVPVEDVCRVGVSITDSGIGISKHKQRDIFTMFTRLHLPSEYPGTGLGLALCQRIALNHKATIEVYSRAGQGSTFTIWFPRRAGA